MLAMGRARQGSERRQATRNPADFCARIRLDGGAEVNCRVKDFSATGAQLVVPSVLGIPEEFTLQSPTGHSRRVRVQRRGVGRIGVAFI